MLTGVKGIILTIFLSIITIIDVISYILYILLLFFLIKEFLKKESDIKKEFHIILIFNGILDIIYITEEYLSFRIPQFGFFRDFYLTTFSKSFVSGFCYVYSICQANFIFLSGITITFNRYFAIKYPVKYGSLWSGWKLFFLIIWPLIIVLPIFIKFHSAEGDYLEEDTGRLYVVFVDININNDIWSISIYIHCIALLINGILTVCLIFLTKKKFKNVIGQTRTFKIDIILTKYAITYFIMFGLLVFVEVPLTIAMNMEAYTFASDMFTLIALCQSLIIFFPPYGILFLSKELRKSFFQSLCFKKKIINNTVAVQVTSFSQHKKGTPR